MLLALLRIKYNILMSALSGKQEEQILLPIETLFQYRGHERYLSMEEYIKASPTEEILQSHALLDEEFSIIYKKKHQLINLPSEAIPQDEPVAFLVKEQLPPLLFQKAYPKYELDDFIFGRESWGRTINCLRISNDMISRFHARLSCQNIAHRHSKRQLMLELQKTAQLSHYSSPFRKVPKGLWNKIVAYAQEWPRYTLRDCGSRNGTFLMNCSIDQVFLKVGEGYELENRDYIIYINEVYQEKGSSVASRLAASQDQWKTQEFYNQHNSFRIICSPQLKENLAFIETTVQAIYFQVDYPEHKHFFWIITTNQHERYSIGEGQTISVYSDPEQHYEACRHGTIILAEGKWSLRSSFAREPIWVKLPAEKDYELSPITRYRIRLGHLNIVNLSFHNFF